MQIILTESEYEELIKRESVEITIQDVLRNLRSAGVGDRDYKAILELFLTIGNRLHIQIKD